MITSPLSPRLHAVFAAAALLLAGAAYAQDVRVAVPAALTGPYAFVGVPITNGIVLALEEAQASGAFGNVKVTWTVDDDASDKAQAITLVNRYATRDNVQLVLGPTSSIEAAAAAPVANDLQIPLLSPALSEVVTKAGKWSFKVTSAPTQVMGSLAKYAADKAKIKSIALVFVRDNEGYISQKNTMKAALESLGTKVLAEESVVGSDTDFSAVATKLIALKPEALFIAAPPEIAANVILQARQNGLPATTKLLGVSTMASPQFSKIGGSAVDGTVFVADYFVGNPSEANKKFVQAYTHKHHGAPDNWAAVGYTLGQMGVLAIKNAGPKPDRAKIREALERTKDMPVILGTGVLNLDQNRNPYYGAAVLSVKQGQMVLAE
jgi:branched-chain amino acid transport system substrate-binding protein